MQKVKEQLAEGSKSKLLEMYNYKSFIQLLESNLDNQKPAQVELPLSWVEPGACTLKLFMAVIYGFL
jgi:hypothetical protein